MYTQEEQKTYLENIRSGGIATGIRLLIPLHACPVCQYHEGGYKFDNEDERPIPLLPFEGCSCQGGCRAFYSPILDLHGP